MTGAGEVLWKWKGERISSLRSFFKNRIALLTRGKGGGWRPRCLPLALTSKFSLFSITKGIEEEVLFATLTLSNLFPRTVALYLTRWIQHFFYSPVGLGLTFIMIL